MYKVLVMLGTVGTSLSAIFVRYSSAPSLVLVLYRTVFASLLLSPFLLLRCRDQFRGLTLRAVLLCVLSGCFFGLHLSFYFLALANTSIASAVVLVNTEVFFVALGSFLFLKQSISRRGWVGMILAFLGSCIIASADMGGGSNVILGDFYAVAGAFFAAVYTIIGTLCRRKLSTSLYTYFVYLSAALTVLAILLFQGTPLLGYEPKNFLTALGLAVCCTLLGHSVYSWGLKYVPAAFVAMVKLLEPLFSAGLGVLLFHEIPGIAVAIGGVIVVGGLLIYSRSTAVPEKAKTETV